MIQASALFLNNWQHSLFYCWSLSLTPPFPFSPLSVPLYTRPLPYIQLDLSFHPHYHLVDLFRAVIASDMTYVMGLRLSLL